MSQNLHTVQLGIGLGDLHFGMDREEVTKLLGKPDEVDNFYLDDAETCESESWYYDDKGLSISFEAEEAWKLMTMEVDSEALTLEGNTLIGISKQALFSLLESLDINDLSEEANPTEGIESHELVSSNKKEINFWLEEGLVSEVQWGPFYTADDQIIWPK